MASATSGPWAGVRMGPPPPPLPPPPPPSPGVMGTLKGGLNVAWAWGAAFDLLERAATSTWSHMPIFTHAVTVGVSGGPAADLRRVWYLTCAIAFGRALRSPAIRGGTATMQASWNVSEKACQIELVYQVAKTQYSEDAPRATESTLLARLARWTLGTVTGAGGTALAAGLPLGRPPGGGALSPKDSPLSFVQQGPDQITVGAGWPQFLMRHDQVNAVRNRPAPTTFRDLAPVDATYTVTPLTRVNSAGSGVGAIFREHPIVDARGDASFYPFQIIQITGTGAPIFAGTAVDRRNAPTLPDHGRVITTGEKSHPLVQSPRPCIDGATRSSLVTLVANELSDPCYLPPMAPTGPVPLFSTGYQLYPAGFTFPYAEVARRANTAANDRSDPDVGGDGRAPLRRRVTDFR